MFHTIAERRVRQMFQSLSEGDYEPALVGLAEPFEHTFAGDHALGGTRHTADGFRAWFERLFRLFPNLNFEIRSIAVSGPPWDIVSVVEWIDRATPAGGGTYENCGVHVIRLHWGKLASIHAYLDTHVIIETLRVMAANGFEEAAAAPIKDPEGVRDTARGSQLTPARNSRSRALGTAAGTSVLGTSQIGAIAVGALAVGALAIGALAIGRLAIGRLTLRSARIGRLEIDELVVRHGIDRAGDPR